MSRPVAAPPSSHKVGLALGARPRWLALARCDVDVNVLLPEASQLLLLALSGH